MMAITLPMDKVEVGSEKERRHPYARAREAGLLSPETIVELALDIPGALKRFNSQLRSLSNQQRWRILNQHRCALVAVTLRACERALGSSYAGRERGEDRGWILFAHDDQGGRVAVLKISPSQPKRFDDFAVPIELTVLEPTRFNVETFEAWRRDDGSHRRRRRATSRAAAR
jgi:hypothetical protein